MSVKGGHLLWSPVLSGHSKGKGRREERGEIVGVRRRRRRPLSARFSLSDGIDSGGGETEDGHRERAGEFGFV